MPTARVAMVKSLPAKYARAARVGLALPMYRLTPDRPRFARWLRTELEEAGCLFVKIGQWVSSRTDIFPADVTSAFASLQKDVSAMPPGEVRRVLACAGLDRASGLEQLDPVPVSCGSVAQVHRAVYRGLDVAVKVQRPGLLASLDEDLGLVRNCLALLRLQSAKSYEDALKSLDDLGATIKQETDFVAEAAAMERFRAFYEGRGGADGVRVPRTYVATPEVLVMEWLPSAPVRDPRDCARLMRLFLTQFFELGHVHTDLHAGNLGVDASGSIVLYDFGSVLACPRDMRTCVKRLFVSYLNRNPAVMLDYMTRYGVLRSRAPLTADQRRTLEAFVGTVLDYVETTDIRSFQQGVRGIPAPAALPSVEFRPEVFMAFRSFTLLEGLCKEIDPDFVILDAMTPFALELLADPEIVRMKIEDDLRTLMAL